MRHNWYLVKNSKDGSVELIHGNAVFVVGSLISDSVAIDCGISDSDSMHRWIVVMQVGDEEGHWDLLEALRMTDKAQGVTEADGLVGMVKQMVTEASSLTATPLPGKKKAKRRKASKKPARRTSKKK